MLTALLAFLGVSGGSVYLGVISDPETSRTVNTFLNLLTLVFVWWTQKKNSNENGSIFQKVDKVHSDVVHAASAAASAAEASAESARVIKDIGSTLRRTDTPGELGH